MATKKAFSLTLVEYDPSDSLGFVLAFVTPAPIYIMVMYATLVVFRRDLHVMFLLIGQVLNEALNYTLKHLIKQPRPVDSGLGGNGMPSAHSQFMMFFAVYVMLFVTKRATIQRMHEKFLAGAGAHALAMLVCFARVRLGYHTIAQVAVGSTVGIITGYLYFQFINNYFAPRYFALIENTSVAKFLLIRDTSNIPDLLSFEYEVVQSLKKKKQK